MTIVISSLTFRQHEHPWEIDVVQWVDPTHLFISTHGKVHLREMKPDQAPLITAYQHPGDRGYLSPGGALLAISVYDAILIFDAETGEHRCTCTSRVDDSTSLAWSPDGTRIASGRSGGVVRVYDSRTGAQIAAYERHRGPIVAVTWSPDGRRIASGGGKGEGEDKHLDCNVDIWNAATGDQILRCDDHRGAITSVAWSPDGKRLASASWDYAVRVWNTTTGDLMMSHSHKGAVFALAWSPDGKQIASGGAMDGNRQCDIDVWPVTRSRKSVIVNKGHTRDILALAWSLDGRYIASASADSIIRVWSPLVRRPQPSIQLPPAWQEHPVRLLSLEALLRAQEQTEPRDSRIEQIEAILDNYEASILHDPETYWGDIHRLGDLKTVQDARIALASIEKDLSQER